MDVGYDIIAAAYFSRLVMLDVTRKEWLHHHGQFILSVGYNLCFQSCSTRRTLVVGSSICRLCRMTPFLLSSRSMMILFNTSQTLQNRRNCGMVFGRVYCICQVKLILQTICLNRYDFLTNSVCQIELSESDRINSKLL